MSAFLQLAAGLPGSFVVTNDAVRIHVEGDVAWVFADGEAAWDRGAGGPVLRLPYRTTGILAADQYSSNGRGSAPW